MQGIKVQMLTKPNSRCGRPLESGATTKVRGITITNTRGGVVYVDVYTRHYKKVRKSK